MDESDPEAGAVPPLPVVGEAPDALWEAVRGGQPVVLTSGGRPAVVVVDLGSWAEIEALLREDGAGEW